MTVPETLLEKVLTRLGFNQRPELTHAGLTAVYAAWCQKVPFDNVQKLVHLHEGRPGSLPGTDPAQGLENWLRHGTGGTCWSSSTSLHALLQGIGFEADRGIATMLAAPNLPPNHATVRVRLDDQHYLVDSAILFGTPLLLDDDRDELHIDHPAWGLRGTRKDGLLHLHWRPLHMPEGLDCRYEYFGATHEEYEQRHEDTRDWSPFNYQLTARRNRGDEVIGASFGNAVTLRADGSVEVRPIDDTERRRILIEDFGMSEEIISRLPADRPTPPPPGSATALAQAT